MRFNFFYTVTILVLLSCSTETQAKVTSYLPLQQNQLLEQKVDQLFVFANQPIAKRPIAIRKVRSALNKVCPSTRFHHCQELKTYLQSLQQTAALSHASLTAQASDEKQYTRKNKRGSAYQDDFIVQGQGIVNLSDYASISVGAQITNEEQSWEDSYISVGTDWAQLDLGYKPHWFSPFKHSAMLISTHAPTMATLSLSNSSPLSPLNINYELFVGEMSESNRIRYQGEYITGNPILTGFHLEFSPFSGFSLAVNRLLQSGGGEREGNSFSDLLNAFFDPSGADNTSDELGFDEQFGNQNASLTSQFTFSGETPFYIYLEYAGEDTSRGSNWRLGNSSLSAGVFIPLLIPNLSLTYEWSEWQNAWYSHSVYHDGMSNKGNIIGHWAAEYRTLEKDYYNNAVGAQHQYMQLDWYTSTTDSISLQLSHTANENYGAIDYIDAYNINAAWQTTINSWPMRSEIEVGRDAFDNEYYRFALEVSL
ncbi:MAG: hypothetical protein HWE10_00515 [Gammaproteobacteria bacterium]|nr:hypothetical protein [Gammaproteobacteria bacterium]